MHPHAVEGKRDDNLLFADIRQPFFNIYKIRNIRFAVAVRIDSGLIEELFAVKQIFSYRSDIARVKRAVIICPYFAFFI